MDRHFTIHIRARNDHSVLQRILLAFSRRRLRIRALQFFDVDPARPAEMQFELACTAERAAELEAQLRAIVEVTRVCAQPAPQMRDPEPAARLAAA